MNTSITSKESIMEVCRTIVAKKGLSALNMRTVADACHIALGTLYNYYSDKEDLLLATVESVWKDIFHMNQKCEINSSFPDYISDLFDCVQTGIKAYPDFFMAHSMSIVHSRKGEAKEKMEYYFAHMKNGMLQVLKQDEKVLSDTFTETFTEVDFIDFVLDHMLFLLVQGKASCKPLMEIIRRILY